MAKQAHSFSQYILGYELFSNPTDTRTLRLFFITLKECFFELPTDNVADAGYGGGENDQTILKDHERTFLIPYSMYHQEQKKTFKQHPFFLVNWSYQELDATFLCTNRRKMRFRPLVYSYR